MFDPAPLAPPVLPAPVLVPPTAWNLLTNAAKIVDARTGDTVEVSPPMTLFDHTIYAPAVALCEDGSLTLVRFASGRKAWVGRVRADPGPPRPTE